MILGLFPQQKLYLLYVLKLRYQCPKFMLFWKRTVVQCNKWKYLMCVLWKKNQFVCTPYHPLHPPRYNQLLWGVGVKAVRGVLMIAMVGWAHLPPNQWEHRTERKHSKEGGSTRSLVMVVNVIRQKEIWSDLQVRCMRFCSDLGIERMKERKRI